MSYSSKILATVKQIQEITNINIGEVIENLIGEPEKEIPIAEVMVMIRSKYCNTNIKRFKILNVHMMEVDIL